MLHIAGSREAEKVSHVTQTTRHALDRGDWTQLKTPIIARRAERTSGARTRSVALAERLCVTCPSVSPGGRSPRPWLQKYNLDNASALIGRRTKLL
jgi:hypothetical protein